MDPFADPRTTVVSPYLKRSMHKADHSKNKTGSVFQRHDVLVLLGHSVTLSDTILAIT